jgi:hypothetical protein
VCIHGAKQERYLKRIKKVLPAFKDDIAVNYEEYSSFQEFLCHTETLKMKLQQWRYLDFEMFWDHIQEYNKATKSCISKN